MALTKEQLEKFLSIVETGIQNGCSLKQCFEQASKELHKTPLTLYTYWYKYDYFKEAREKISKIKAINNWNEELDLEFIKLMKKYIDEGYKIEEALNEVAKAFNKTFSQCYVRWYQYITKHYDVSFIKRRKAAVNVIKKDNTSFINFDENDNKLLKLMTFYLNYGLSVYEALANSSKELGMTYAQCRNRWYKKVKFKYEEMKGQLDNQNNETIQLNLNDDDKNLELSKKDVDLFIIKISNLIQLNKELQEYKQKYDESVNKMIDIQKENAELKREKEELNQMLETLKRKNKILKKKLNKLEQEKKEIEDDYNSLLKIINKARELSLSEIENESTTIKFKMDKNGNLEKID